MPEKSALLAILFIAKGGFGSTLFLSIFHSVFWGLRGTLPT
jgi:hypothetical protein